MTIALRALALATAVASLAASAADIVLTPPAGGGVSITNAAGDTTRLRVAEDGALTLPGVTAASQPATGLCVDNATQKVGTCSVGGGGGTITGVTALAPLTSSGGTAPAISLTGIVPVAKGGTGLSSFPIGVLVGQGGGPIKSKVGNVGHVLVGTVEEPEWTHSPEIGGSLVLPAVSASNAGNVMKGTTRFLHNFGAENTFLGLGAGNFAMTGSGNTAAGFQAFVQNVSSNFNSAVGAHALENNTIGSQNTALGWGALKGNASGANNVAIGHEALAFNTASHENVAVGAAAMKFTTGGNNVAIGNSAGIQLAAGTFNVAIASYGDSGDSGTIRIGEINDQTRAFVAGIRGVTTGAADAVPVLIDSNGQLGTASASRQQGEFTFAGGAAGVNVKTITFPTPFATVPKVIVTAKTDDFGGGPVNDTLVASVRSISTTQFQVNVFRVDIAGGAWSANTRLAWMAWQ
jgi:hypothetical protein